MPEFYFTHKSLISGKKIQNKLGRCEISFIINLFFPWGWQKLQNITCYICFRLQKYDCKAIFFICVMHKVMHHANNWSVGIWDASSEKSDQCINSLLYYSHHFIEFLSNQKGHNHKSLNKTNFIKVLSVNTPQQWWHW